MRFDVNITLSDKEIPKDKSRMFLSFIKHNLSKNNKIVLKNCMEKVLLIENYLQWQHICQVRYLIKIL